MEMQQVRYFVALAETLNFTRAAEKCNVSQPALTRAIQQLEHELGGPLFHRERGNTHLSELGRMMFPYLQTVEDSARAAREQAKAVKKLERATLTIGTMCTIGPQLVSDLMIRFQAAHPNVEVRVIDAGAPQMIEMLRFHIDQAFADDQAMWAGFASCRIHCISCRSSRNDSSSSFRRATGCAPAIQSARLSWTRNPMSAGPTAKCLSRFATNCTAEVSSCARYSARRATIGCKE